MSLKRFLSLVCLCIFSFIKQAAYIGQSIGVPGVAGGIGLTRPEGYIVERQPVVFGLAINHSSDFTVADWDCFFEILCGAVIMKFKRTF